MFHEVELKFDLAPADVPQLLDCRLLAGQAPRNADYENAYFDTKEGLLREAGFSLRLRRSEGRYVQTVKRKRASAVGFFIRQEWETDVAGFALDLEALGATPLKKLLGGDDGHLVPVMRSSFRRTAWKMTHKGSRVEIMLDCGHVKSGNAQAPICEIELELGEGKPRALFDLAEEIGRAVPLRLGVLSKAERGYALAERRLGKPAKAEPIGLSASRSEADAFRAVAQACLRHYRLNEIVLLGARDAEALHQARIALRRLRSAFSLFRSALRGKDYRPLRDELGWLAGQFGDARNLDVLLAGEAGMSDDGVLHARLLKARGKAYDCVEKALGSERARALMLRLALWIDLGAWRFRAKGDGGVAALAEHQLERQWRRIRRHGSRIAKGSADERHRLRLDIKKLRYSAEFLAGLHGKRPKLVRRDRFIAALKDLQDRLGDLNDAEAAETMTTRLAPRLKGSADRIRRRALVDDGIAAAEEALDRASASAGYWL